METLRNLSPSYLSHSKEKDLIGRTETRLAALAVLALTSLACGEATTTETGAGSGGQGGGQIECPLEGTSCESPGVGECKTEGVYICEEGKDVCDAFITTPQKELCDGLDNSCSGTADDEGACFTTVSFPEVPGVLRKLFHIDENGMFVSQGSYGIGNTCGEIGVDSSILNPGERYFFYIGEDSTPISYEVLNANTDIHWGTASANCPSFTSLENQIGDGSMLSNFEPTLSTCLEPNHENPDCVRYTIDPTTIVAVGQPVLGEVIFDEINIQEPNQE